MYVFLPENMLDPIQLLVRHISQPNQHITPARDRGVAIEQSMSGVSILGSPVYTVRAMANNINLSARASMTYPSPFEQDLVETTVPFVFRNDLWTNAVTKVRKEMDDVSLLYFDESRDPSLLQTVKFEPVIRGTHIIRYQRENLHAPYRPKTKVRVDLSRTTFDVEPIDVLDLPHDVLAQPDVKRLLRVARRSASFITTNDMRHDVLIASWNDRDVRIDVGARLG